MSESCSKRRRVEDERIQDITQSQDTTQSSDETSNQTGETVIESSEDSTSLPAMTLSPVPTVEPHLIIDSASNLNLEFKTGSDYDKCFIECEKIVRKAKDLAKNKHLIIKFTEIKINEIYEKICLLWETLLSEHQVEKHEIPSTSSQDSANIYGSTSKILNIIRNEIPVLRASNPSSEGPCEGTSVSMSTEETYGVSVINPSEEKNTSTSSMSEQQSLIDSSYAVEIVLQLIRYTQEQMLRNMLNISSKEGTHPVTDAKENIHVDLLKQLRLCMLEEAAILKRCIDVIQKIEIAGDKMDIASDSDEAIVESEENSSAATEIQTISSSSDSEVKGDDSLKTKVRKIFGTATPGEKYRESFPGDTEKEATTSSVEMEMPSISVHEHSDTPSGVFELDSDMVPILGNESETVSRRQYHPDLTLSFKSSETDVGDEQRSTGPCVTEDTLLSTPDEDTGKSISSIPWDSVSFHSSIPDEQLDSETEETEL